MYTANNGNIHMYPINQKQNNKQQNQKALLFFAFASDRRVNE